MQWIFLTVQAAIIEIPRRPPQKPSWYDFRYDKRPAARRFFSSAVVRQDDAYEKEGLILFHILNCAIFCFAEMYSCSTEVR